MKFTVEIDSEKDPNACGEFLRNKFFGTEKGFGCYENFVLNCPEVTPLPAVPVENNQDEFVDWKWTRAKWQQIEMRYYWDGDGVLVFIFPDGSALVNDDCKKDYVWEYVSDYKEWAGASGS